MMLPAARQPQLEVHPVEDHVKELELGFTLHDTDTSVANALRRTMIAEVPTMIAEVPTMAIDLVTVEVDTSPLHDDYIAHRLGLIPLVSKNINDFKRADLCPCTNLSGFCEDCGVQFEINEECPRLKKDLKEEEESIKIYPEKSKEDETKKKKMAEEVQDLNEEKLDEECPEKSNEDENKKKTGEQESLIVTSIHLKNIEHVEKSVFVLPVHSSGALPPTTSTPSRSKESKEPRKRLHGGVIITKLAPGQRIHMKMLARKGVGKEHAKWSPMCSVAYSIEPPPVEIDLLQLNNILVTDIDTKNKIVGLAEGLLRYDVTSECLEYEQPFLLGRIGITQDTIRHISEILAANGHSQSRVFKHNKAKRFVFNAETTGAMSPACALRLVLSILQKKLDASQSFLRD